MRIDVGSCAQAREVNPLAASCGSRVYTVETGALSTLLPRPQLARGRLAVPAVRPLNWADALRCAVVARAALLSRPHRQAPTTAGWTGRCGPARRWCAPFDAPSPNWNRGHRGVDLAGAVGQPVYAAGPATVVFAGMLAGRPVVSLAHPGGLRTSYEPVEAAVRVGQLVDAPTATRHACSRAIRAARRAACLHWGAMWGPASRADYVDPLGLLASTPIRLKPCTRCPRECARHLSARPCVLIRDTP